MHARSLIFGAVIASLVCGGNSNIARAQDSQKDLDAAIQEVKQISGGDIANPGAKDSAQLSDKLMDIHGSGWLYNKKESEELRHNQSAMPVTTKPIKHDESEVRYVAYTKDLVAVSSINTTYYEVPNPQDIAKAAGTMTNDPAAMARAKAAQMRANGPAPGETEAPNPYRARRTNVWARINGKWQVIVTASTRVGEKVVPGHY